jgi:hypothetical protein
LRQQFQDHTHEALNAEPDISIDEERATPRNGKKFSPADLFGDDYQI